MEKTTEAAKCKLTLTRDHTVLATELVAITNNQFDKQKEL